MRPSALILLVIVLAGCAQSSAASSSLDQFDMLAAPLRSATIRASAVAADVRAINQGMKHNNRRWIRQSALKLKGDSARLSRKSIELQAKVNRILKAQSTGVQRQYVGITLSAVRYQQWEAHWAWRLADTVQRDPLLISPANYEDACFDARRAARAAEASVLSVRRARNLEAHHRGQFGLTGEPGSKT